LAVDNGITVVSTKGNTSGKISSSAYTLKVIAVEAVDKNNKRANFSKSELALDIVVLGVNIYSTVPQNSYGFLCGTSRATSHPAGTVALLLDWEQ
jgi:subtilisin family serine protease